MPYVANDTDDEDQKPGAPVAPVAGGAVHLAPSSGVGSAPTSPGTAAPQPAGGSFASLDKYVNANQGQAQPLANKITSGIGDQYTALNSGNQSTLTNLSNQVAGAYTPNNPDLLAKEAANPVSFSGDAGNVTAFQGLLNDKYTGPNSAESASDFQAQQSKVNDAIAKGNTQTQTDAGRQQLVAGVSAKPTAGVTALNSAVLSKDPNALGQVQNAYKPFDNLVSGLSSGATDINAQIAKAQTDSQAANKAANDALTGQVGTLNATVGNETTAAQNTIDNYNANVGAAGSATTSANQAIQNFISQNPQLNADPSVLTPFMNLAAYTGPGATNQTAATSQDYDTAKALQTLAGASPVNTSITGDTASQAGTAIPSSFQGILDQIKGLPGAVSSQVGDLGKQITDKSTKFQSDYDTYTKAANDFSTGLGSQAQVLARQLASTPQTIMPPRGAGSTPIPNPAYAEISKQYDAAQAAAQKDVADMKSVGGSTGLSGEAQGLQWLPGAATNYNGLLSTLNSTLAPVQAIQIPDISTGGSNGGNMGDLAQVIANPALDLAKLSLSPDVLNGLGSKINNVINDINGFFKNLF